MRTRRYAVAVLACMFLLAVSAAAQITPDVILKRLGQPPTAKLLVIHADDFGIAHSADKAIMEALEKGWVTSASIMVPCPWFPEVVQFAKAHPDADLGLHLVLTSEWLPYRWGPLTYHPGLLDKDGYLPLLESTAGQQDNPADVDAEIRAQIERAKSAGIKFTHLDSHMGTLFENQALFDVYQKAGHDYNVPNFIASGENAHGAHAFQVHPDRLVMTTDIQMTPGVTKDQWLDAYKKMLTGLKPGVYQLIVHLGYNDEELQTITAGHPNWGAEWRESDLKLVSNPEFHQFLKDNGFTLITWRELSKAMHE